MSAARNPLADAAINVAMVTWLEWPPLLSTTAPTCSFW
jgi:hypothetical protein